MSRRGPRPHDSKHYWDWVEAAYLDRLAAELLMTDERLYEASAFHCQQCTEKSLKAYLLMKTGNLVDGHNLTWLCKQAVKHDPTFQEWLDESAYLNHYYIETRYPSDFQTDITKERILTILTMTQRMNQFIFEEVKQHTKEESTDTPNR